MVSDNNRKFANECDDDDDDDNNNFTFIKYRRVAKLYTWKYCLFQVVTCKYPA